MADERVPVTIDEEILADLEREGVLPPAGEYPAGADWTDDKLRAALQLFGDPKQWRTMGRLTQEQALLLSYIHARGKWLNSSFRQQLVENYLLMSRSIDAWGSHEMAEIARRVPSEAGQRPRGLRGFFTGWRRREG